MHVIIIPAYQPNESMIKFIEDLIQFSLEPIIVVNDGSGAKYASIFEDAVKLGCYLAVHDSNLGKGAAIKSGILKANALFDHIESYITCDSDGQHLARDVYEVVELSKQNINTLILGTRDFKKSGVPFKSKVGNFVSTIYFYLAAKLYCPDTQTGLRSIPFQLTSFALSLKEDHYDYEMAFLLTQAKAKYKIIYITIETVYINHNQNSHFKPIHDSILIYKQPLRFTFVSLTSLLIDISIFTLIVYLLSASILETVAIASISARLISGIYNFMMNRLWSFRSKHNIKHQFMKYFILYFFQLGTSIIFVTLLSSAFRHLSYAKLIVDGILFLMSYQVQKLWVFSKKNISE